MWQGSRIQGNHKDDYKTKIHDAIISVDLESADEELEIGINADVSVSFTQTHLTEVQILLRLIDEYGLPDDENCDLEGVVNAHSPLGNIPRREDVNSFGHEISNRKQKISDIGARVKHKIYGLGKVEECFGDRITILFDDGKKKTFDLKACVRVGVLTL